METNYTEKRMEIVTKYNRETGHIVSVTANGVPLPYRLEGSILILESDWKDCLAPSK